VGIKFYGTVVAVGLNDKGQRDVDSWSNVVQVAAGGYHTVGLKSDGTVVAVGKSDEDQLEVSSWSGIVQVAAGGYHTVGLKSDGTVVTAGWNYYGQRDDVSSWSGIVQVAAGFGHTVGLKSDGTVVTAGWNRDGQREVGSWNLGSTSYSILGDFAPADCDVDGSNLAALIANASLIDLPTFSQNFGKNACR
jgi:alpha-tubulin suppressor-like RCC1 family protein